MTLPPSYDRIYERDKICKLRKALHGLKQSPRFSKFRRTMRMLRNIPCNCSPDHTQFFQHFQTGGVKILIVYVDNIILTGNNHKEAIKLEMQLTTHFEVKKIGAIKYFLGIEIAKSSDGYLMI